MEICDPKLMCKYGIHKHKDAMDWLRKNDPNKRGNDKINIKKYMHIYNCFRERNYCPITIENNDTSVTELNSSIKEDTPTSITELVDNEEMYKYDFLSKKTPMNDSYITIDDDSSPIIDEDNSSSIIDDEDTSSSIIDDSDMSNSSINSSSSSIKSSYSTMNDDSNNSISDNVKSKRDEKITKKRKKLFTCMRQIENWSKILAHHKMDKKEFNKKKVKELMHNASPKMEQLFEIIKQVDDNDFETHGRYFKHFIFSDVKEEGYGAKILASGFIANGYNSLIDSKKGKLVLKTASQNEKNNSFGLLSSSAIFKSEFNQKLKKEVLSVYNNRPDNIHGENMRFIILDSGFKEGIDLFDVKYVHIFEPSMTTADIKQTIGRATRTCGQKGLHFEPNEGWKLFVYNYNTIIPDDIKDIYKVSHPELLNDTIKDDKIFKYSKKLKDSAIFYSTIDRTMSNLEEQLYKLAPIFAIDYDLTKKIHNIDEIMYLYDDSSSSVGGGGAFNKNKTIVCNGKCGKRSTIEVPPDINFLLNVYNKYNHDTESIPPKNKREFLCKYMKQNEDYCKQLNKEWAIYLSDVPNSFNKSNKSTKKTMKQVSNTQKVTNKDTNKTKTKTKKLSKTIKLSKIENSLPSNSSSLYSINEIDSLPSNSSSSSSINEIDSLPSNISSSSSINEIDSLPSNISSSSSNNTELSDSLMKDMNIIEDDSSIDNSYSIEEYSPITNKEFKKYKDNPPPKKLNFKNMRDFIKTNFSDKYSWDDIVVENRCVNRGGGKSNIMNLNPTQDFVRKYFTPASPYKGILLWHSVGTGKTCTAIATATTTFEQEGYTILWVTRNTLKSDVYKNIFDDVCHQVLVNKIKNEGIEIPSDPLKRKKLLSKSWIEPISYKTFSNLLTPGGHNEYLDKLISINGKKDVLRKTLIIIDEAHKLYGGDLKAAERPNMEIMEKLLQKSYEISGKDSARLIIMTATPFTNSPMELFKLVNLCKDKENEKIVTEKYDFKRKYMGDDSYLTEQGVKRLSDKLSGYISYLNRENDPTQFAQPIMIDVPVLMSHIEDNELRKDIFKNITNDKSQNAKETIIEYEKIIKEKNKKLRETKKKSKNDLENKQKKCKTIKNRTEKSECMKKIKDEVELIYNNNIDTLRDEIEQLNEDFNNDKIQKRENKKKNELLKKKIEKLRERYLQETMLIERCGNIKLA